MSRACKNSARDFFLKKKRHTFAETKKNSNFAPLLNEEASARLAQLVEQLTLNQWVQGSNP